MTRYPLETVVRPEVLERLAHPASAGDRKASGTLAIESVTTPFYFLLFGAIRRAWADHVAGPALLLSVRSSNGAVGTGLAAAVKRSAPIAWLWDRPWERAYGEGVDGVAYRAATWAHPWIALRNGFRARRIWRDMRASGRCETSFEGVALGDLIIDSYLRFKPAPKFDIDDPFVCELIWRALCHVEFAGAWFAKTKPRAYLTSYTTYLEHGVPVRVALREGVPVWSFGSLNRTFQRLTAEHWFHPPDTSAYRRLFDALDHRAERLAQAEAKLQSRFAGVIDGATSYMRQTSYGHTSEPLPETLRGAAVIFLHDFYDSPHVYADLVFDDFMQWVCTTIDTLRANGVTVFVKPHPNQIAMSAAVLDDLKRAYPDLNWLSPSANTVRLAQAGIACGLTVYGTVAHELAYFGIASITCARHPHHSFDFCRNARTRDEYIAMLREPGKPPLTREEMREQALAFFYMHNLYGTPEEIELRDRYTAFWRACHIGEADDATILATLDAFVSSPGFAHMVGEIAGVVPETREAGVETLSLAQDACHSSYNNISTVKG
ncbi:hypothetical protein [Pandoraea sp. NPDC087047]|uniref:hypothetical protein n=1 Tax=Pandoraea sp. NPDC087047 TaxID=3364390 RepID=UPI003814F190